jgi:alpha-L-arabinofuranosidase
MEMLQAILNRQGSCSMQEIDEQLDQEFAEWQKQAEEIYQQIKKAEYFAELPKLSVKEATELKKLYRKLAKKFHPDVNPHEWDERKNFWLRIKDAYQNGDLQEMKTLALLANDFQDQNPEISTMDKLRDDCADLKKRIQELINQIAHVKSQFPFDIEEQLQDEEWVTKQKEEIDIQIDEWQNTKSLYEEKVEELICQINPPQFH